MFSANHKNKLIMGTFQFFFFNFSKILNREFCLCGVFLNNKYCKLLKLKLCIHIMCSITNVTLFLIITGVFAFFSTKELRLFQTANLQTIIHLKTILLSPDLIQLQLNHQRYSIYNNCNQIIVSSDISVIKYFISNANEIFF